MPAKGRGLAEQTGRPANSGIRAFAATTRPRSPIFGEQVPNGVTGQFAELVKGYVMLAHATSSYMYGVTIAVTGGKPIL